MKQTHEIIIQAPLKKIFTAASDVGRWPEFLPHYRSNRFLNHAPWGGTVRMSCVRSGLPVTVIADYRIDTQNHRLHFHYVKSTWNATNGMVEIWNFKELPHGSIRVSISHHLEKKLPFLKTATSDWLIGTFFVHDLAMKTLTGLKRKVETQKPATVVPKSPALRIRTKRPVPRPKTSVRRVAT